MNKYIQYKNCIENGKAILGIELGSTRIKAIVIDEKSNTLAKGEYSWENDYVDGIWTYSLEKVNTGLQTCYKNLKNDIYNLVFHKPI